MSDMAMNSVNVKDVEFDANNFMYSIDPRESDACAVAKLANAVAPLLDEDELNTLENMLGSFSNARKELSWFILNPSLYGECSGGSLATTAKAYIASLRNIRHFCRDHLMVTSAKREEI